MSEPSPSDYGTPVRILAREYVGEYGVSRGPSYLGTVRVELDSGDEIVVMEKDLRVVELEEE